MGEIADDMLNGDFDEITGEYIGPGEGYPRTRYGRPTRNKNHQCPHCSKRFLAKFSMKQHIKDKHPDKASE